MNKPVETGGGLPGSSDFGEGQIRVPADSIQVGDVYVGFKKGEDLRIKVEKISLTADPQVLLIEGSDADGVHREARLANLPPETGGFRIERKPKQS